MGYQMWLGWPNVVSLARIALVGPFVGCLVWINADAHPDLRHVALGLFVLMAISDGLDGYLARRLNQETALGRFLDPLGDKLLIASGVIVLTIIGIPDAAVGGWCRLPVWLTAALLGKDLLVLIGSIVVYRRTKTPLIAPRPIGKLCTSAAFLLILFMLLMPDLPANWAVIRTVLIWATLIMSLAASADYVRLGLQIAAGKSAWLEKRA